MTGKVSNHTSIAHLLRFFRRSLRCFVQKKLQLLNAASTQALVIVSDAWRVSITWSVFDGVHRLINRTRRSSGPDGVLLQDL